MAADSRTAWSYAPSLRIHLMSGCSANCMHYTGHTSYEIGVGQIDRGASVKWISYFPAEEEVLLPPLCSIEASGTVRYEEVEVLSHGKGAAGPTNRTVMIWPV
eukprot:3640163-Rhodomonas_salina.2